MRLAECHSANDQSLGKLAQGIVKETGVIMAMVTVVTACRVYRSDSLILAFLAQHNSLVDLHITFLDRLLGSLQLFSLHGEH